MNIGQLKQRWQKEKAIFLKKEVGTGVQDFVYEIFKSPEIFNLEKGLESTPIEKRRNEFTKESRNKNGQADAVIFINSEIVIPVEVEKFENIKAGEWQILKYRTAFDKKYGILTDGNEWRFYYGEDNYYIFDLEEILNETKKFLGFWQEYIKPQNYYLSFFEDVGQQKFEFFKEKLSVEKNRQRFFTDITEIIKKLKDKLLNAGYFEEIENKKQRNKKAVEIAYSYLIQFVLYKTLVDNSFDDFPKDFRQIENGIHENLKKESFSSTLSILEGISAKISKNIYKPFKEEQKIIFEKMLEAVRSAEENLLKVAPFLDIFVFIKKFNFANVQNDIFGAVYENYLKELYEEENFGQYFTDPNVVNFMLDEIGYTKEKLKKREHKNISIIDPACGSGTFLYSAVREIMASRDYSDETNSKKIEDDVIENVFGLDISEFPLYLAEMSILMKMLPMIVNEKYNNPIDKKLKLFITEDSVAEFVEDVGRKKHAENQMVMRLPFKYESFMRDEVDLDDLRFSLKNYQKAKKQFSRKRFDFVIANPPYISYNECSKTGVSIFGMIKEKQVKLNDVYGWNLHSIPKNPKKYSPKPNLYAFFLALGFALLKDDGKLCFIIPQTVLTAGDLDVLRYKLAKDYTIEKLYTFAGNLFIGRGEKQKKKIATSSLVLVCEKKPPIKTHKVECIHFKKNDEAIPNIFAQIREGKNISKKKIPQSELLENVENWNLIKQGEKFLDLYEKYKTNSRSIEIYYNHTLAEKEFGERFYFDGGANITKDSIIPFNDEDYELFDNKNNDWSKFNVKRGCNSYPRNKKLIFPQGSQGVVVFCQKYKIVWRTRFTNIFQFCDREILLDGNQSLVISSNNKRGILFLFGILNSKIISNILEVLLKNDEERNYFLPIKSIKKFVRIPKITEQNQSKKEKLIALASDLLESEKQTIGDFVDFGKVLIQKFDNVKVEKENLILKKDSQELKLPIQKGFEKLASEAIEGYFANKKLLATEREISLSALKGLPVIDSAKQKNVKEKIDDLVFDLYGLSDEERKVVLG